MKKHRGKIISERQAGLWTRQSGIKEKQAGRKIVIAPKANGVIVT